MAKDSSELAKQYIDAAVKGRSRPPSKAAYTRALKLARRAIDDLTQLAHRAEGRA
ncbi:MAG TPA: hypothetical protein VJT78_10470 [Candidatus Dormibacteraeota bacterium]|nr:hypothetical protein [Candidatus Dormibacteraeota bacterium]